MPVSDHSWIREGTLVWYEPSPGYGFRAIALAPARDFGSYFGVQLVVLDEAYEAYTGRKIGARSVAFVPAANVSSVTPRSISVEESLSCP
jgi:hypothetical protein